MPTPNPTELLNNLAKLRKDIANIGRAEKEPEPLPECVTDLFDFLKEKK